MNRNDLIMDINIAYSKIWIKITRTNKYVYRKYSLLHKVLMSMLVIG